jgi:ATP-binding cassette subfamily F protein 3
LENLKKMVVEECLLLALPDISDEVKDYVVAVLNENCTDFQSGADIYEAVGDILLSSTGDDVDQEAVTDLCDRLCDLMNIGTIVNRYEAKRLNKAINMHETEASNGDVSEENFIQAWTVKRDTVDSKKLEKAEAKIRQKQDKRSNQELTPNTSSAQLQQVGATANQAANRKDAKQESRGQNNTFNVQLENVDVAFGAKTLLIGADLNIIFGRRYGLVGRNGIGKTTLLKMMSSGQLRIPTRISVLHVEQEVNGDETIVLDSVLECDVERQKLLDEEKQIQIQIQNESNDALAHRLSEIYEQLEHMEADKAPARAAAILHGLGFSAEGQRRPTKEFSGGWRMRLALARALFFKPDLLLLDEPTNMLDMKAIYWLEDYMMNWPTTLLVVSHDRNFLNAVGTDIVHMHNHRLDYYSGNYDMFEKTKSEKLKNQQREFEAQKQFREHVQVFIDRFRYNANRAALVQSKIKMLEKLPELTPIETEPDVVLNFPSCERINPPVLQLDDIGFQYSPDSAPIFKKVQLNADMDSRICIVGENGAGKTTLLKLLLGDLEPTKGWRKSHRLLRLGYFTQHHVDQLDMDVSPVQFMDTKFPGLPVEAHRASLGRFGVSGDLALQSIMTLSGGQKSRLAFAILGMQTPNFLIMDEPTNHLDVESVEALGAALNKFEGGVVLVSHDERLIELVCKELWVVKDNGVRRLDGGLAEYRELIEAELAAQR